MWALRYWVSFLLILNCFLSEVSVLVTYYQIIQHISLYMCTYTEKCKLSRRALKRKHERKMMVCWILLSECRSCPLLKPPYAFLESEKHLRSPEGTACSLWTLPPKSTRSRSFCFNRNHQNNPEGLILKEKSWRQNHLAHDLSWRVTFYKERRSWA